MDYKHRFTFSFKFTENIEINKFVGELEKLNINYKKKDNNIYVFLKNKDIINFMFNLILLSVVCNVKHINTKLKLNKNMIIDKKIGLELIKLFNIIKNYEKSEIIKKGDITEKINEIRLNDKNCVIEQKNKEIDDIINNFLGTTHYTKFKELFKHTQKSKNPFLKRHIKIMEDNLKLNEIQIL